MKNENITTCDHNDRRILLNINNKVGYKQEPNNVLEESDVTLLPNVMEDSSTYCERLFRKIIILFLNLGFSSFI